MKKFLCYDTNDAASDKINVDNRGVLKPNSTVPSGGEPYKSLVTDGECNVKWEDRLAYASVTETELMPEQTVAFSVSGESGYMAYAPVNIGLQGGASYKVNFDGVEYNCICMEDPLPYIGNASGFGLEDTGEPFLYFISEEENTQHWVSYDTSNQHTISVSGPVENVKPIDPKYLPRLNVVISGNDDDGYSSNYTAEEIRSAYYAGKIITGVYIINENKRILTLKEPSILGGSFDYYPIVFYEMVEADEEINYKVSGCYMYKEYRISGRGVTVYKPTECLVLSSSTKDSTKKFKITVDDSGTISATEVTS